MDIREWSTAQKLMIAVLPLALLTACATVSERTVSSGEWAVRNKLSHLQGVQMRDTFISTETASFGKILMCGYINVQTGPNLGFGPLLDRFEVQPEFIRFVYIFSLNELRTEYHQAFSIIVSDCVKPGQNIEEANRANDEIKRAREEAKRAERVRSGGW